MYPDSPTQTSEDYGTISGAKLAQQSPLSSLLDSQEKTAHLLQLLAEKLHPVSNPHPVDNKERADRGYHIETALYRQKEINDAISYIIETVVV